MKLTKNPPKRKPQRRYTEAQRAAAVAAVLANGGNVFRTSREIDIPSKTLEHWVKGEARPEAATTGEQKRGTMAEELERVAWKLLGSIEGKIESAPLSHTATAMGIAIDKARLLRGQPTTITQHDERRSIVAAVLHDPAACDAVTSALERFTCGESQPGPLRDARIGGEVDVPAAPLTPESVTS